MYVTYLNSCGNPDHGEDPDSPLPGAQSELVAVTSLSEAVEACMRFIETQELGGGNWAGGGVYAVTGELVAYISYNGRIWREPEHFPSYLPRTLIRLHEALAATD